MGGDRRQYEFAGYRLDASARELLDPAGTSIALASTTLDTLIYLIEHRERAVPKDELLAAVWRGRAVEENNLTHAISALRKAFGVSAGSHRYIVTFPNHGYRFAAAVTQGSLVETGPADAGGTDPAAERLYLAGRDLVDAPDVSRAKRAIGVFRRVLDIEPGHSRAWSGLAFAWRALTITGDMDPRQAFPLASAAVEKALALEPDSPQAHAAHGFNLFWSNWDWAAAERACQRAISLGPRVVDGHFAYACLLNNLGR